MEICSIMSLLSTTGNQDADSSQHRHRQSAGKIKIVTQENDDTERILELS